MHLCIGVRGDYDYASEGNKDTLLFPSHGENEAIILKTAKMKDIRIFPENNKVQYIRNSMMPTDFPSTL